MLENFEGLFRKIFGLDNTKVTFIKGKMIILKFMEIELEIKRV